MTPEFTTSEQTPNRPLLTLFSPNFGRLTPEQRAANIRFISTLGGAIKSGSLIEPFTPIQASQAMCGPDAAPEELLRVAADVKYYCQAMTDTGTVRAELGGDSYWFPKTLYDSSPRSRQRIPLKN